jgi:hypothetical protein
LQSVMFRMYDTHMGIHGILSMVSSVNHTVGTYYLVLSSLTPKQAVAQSSAGKSSDLLQNPSDTAFITLFGSYGVFIILFIVVLGIFLIGKIRNWRAGVMAVLLAFTLAATPFVLNIVKNGTGGFVTASPDETPRNVKIVPIAQSSVQILWDTEKENIGGVIIGEAPYDMGKARTIIGNYGSKTNVHSVTISGLTHGVTYECEIVSGSHLYDNDGTRLVFQTDK